MCVCERERERICAVTLGPETQTYQRPPSAPIILSDRGDTHTLKRGN